MGREAVWIWAWYGVCLAWMVLVSGWLEPVPYWGLWLLGGYALADAGSYFFHYIVDHYGDPARPGLVRDFQLHHLEPWGIARKSVGQAILPAARFAVPVMALLLLPALLEWLPNWFCLLGFELAALWVFTQVFHRWAHMPVHGLVRWLQRLHLVVDGRAHQRHHCAPFDSHFAVINGWSNAPLDRLGVPLLLDRMLQRLGWRKRGLQQSLVLLATQLEPGCETFSSRARS